jgi:hypothetical protein
VAIAIIRSKRKKKSSYATPEKVTFMRPNQFNL